MGLIQYTVKPDEKVMEIICIFVPNGEDARKGIGKAFLNFLFPYYLIEEGFVYRPRMVGYTPQEEDKGRALIFYDPSCPFCIYFSEKIKEMVKEVAPDIEIRMINQFEESEEVQKRGEVPFCVVNGVLIYFSFSD